MFTKSSSDQAWNIWHHILGEVARSEAAFNAWGSSRIPAVVRKDKALPTAYHAKGGLGAAAKTQAAPRCLFALTPLGHTELHLIAPRQAVYRTHQQEEQPGLSVHNQAHTRMQVNTRWNTKPCLCHVHTIPIAV